MAKDEKTPMTPADASRIQSHADRTGTNQDFKSRSQAAAAKNSTEEGTAGGSAEKSGGKGGR